MRFSWLYSFLTSSLAFLFFFLTDWSSLQHDHMPCTGNCPSSQQTDSSASLCASLPLHPRINLSHTPLPTVHVPLLRSIPPPPPSVLCRQSAVIEHAFHRHSRWDRWPQQWAGSQRVQVPPVRVIPHISAYLIQDRGLLWDHGGV